MINFICSLWGDKYSIDYVDKLYSMVERNCKREFKFYCQTDKIGFREEVNTLPFLRDLPESTPYEMKESKDYLNGFSLKIILNKHFKYNEILYLNKKKNSVFQNKKK